MLQNAPSKKKFPGEPCPLANAWLGHTSQAASWHATRPAHKKVGHSLANHTYSHGNLFEEMCSTLVESTLADSLFCVVHYMFMKLQIFLRGNLGKKD